MEKDKLLNLNNIDYIKLENKDLFENRNINSLLGFPLFNSDGIFTHFILLENDYKHKGWKDDDIYLIKNIINLLQTYFENEKLERKIKHKQEMEHLIHFISTVLFDFKSVDDEKLTEILELLNDTFNSNICGYYNFNDQTHQEIKHLCLKNEIDKKIIVNIHDYSKELKSIFDSQVKDLDYLVVNNNKHSIIHNYKNEIISTCIDNNNIDHITIIPLYITINKQKIFKGLLYFLYTISNQNKNDKYKYDTLKFIKDSFLIYFENLYLYEYTNNLLNSFNDSIFVINSKGIYTYSKVSNIDGEEKDNNEIIGKHLYDFFNKETTMEILDEGIDCIKNRKIKYIEYSRYNKKQQKINQYRSTLSRLNDDEFICIAHNVTEYIEKENKLEYYKNLYLHTVESMPIALLVVNDLLEIKLINNSFLSLVDYKLAYDIMGKNLNDVIQPIVDEATNKYFKLRLYEIFKNKSEEKNLIKKIKINNEFKYVNFNIYFILEDDILISIEDVTDKYLFKSQLESSQKTNKSIIQNIDNIFLRINHNYELVNYHFIPNNLFEDEHILTSNLNKTIDNIIDIDLFKLIRNNIDNIFKTKNTLSFKYELYNDRKKKNLYFNFILALTEEDECVLIINDITNEYYYTKMLEEKKDNYVHFIQNNPQSIIDIDKENYIIKYMNYSFMNTIEYIYDDDKTINLRELIVEDDLILFDQLIHNCDEINREKVKTLRLNINDDIRTFITYCSNNRLNNKLLTLIFIDITNTAVNFENIIDLMINNLNLENMQEVIFEYGINKDDLIIFNMTKTSLAYFNIEEEYLESHNMTTLDLINSLSIDDFIQDMLFFNENKNQVIKNNYLLNNNKHEKVPIYLIPIIHENEIIAIKLLIF
jgi:PAS domain-containing protein